MKIRRRTLVAPTLCVAVSALMTATSLSAATAQRPSIAASRLESITLDQPLTLEHVTLNRAAEGPVQVIARLKSPSVAQGNSKSAIVGEQATFIGRALALAPSARVLGSTQMVLNAVFLELDAADAKKIAADTAVARVTEVGDYRLDLTETVPYIGAETLHTLGVTGAGVRVAVLDSGVDYTHVEFGGAGTATAYTDAYGTAPADSRNKTTDGLFPTAKVVDGYDFVGEAWTGTAPNNVLQPDPDPIANGDLVSNGGHGTHVADIIGGVHGVAPGASILAVKVCSAISTSCSGIGLIQGMDFAVDPNGDGDTSDKVDIINMSLGSNYGQPFDDDLSTAVDAATALGVFTVASAGNGSDKPFVTGSPAAAVTALSVAQTAVPSDAAQLMRYLVPAVTPTDRGAVFQPWSGALTSVIEGPVQYGNGAGGNLNGCAAFPAGSLQGKIVMVNRGTCTFTAKIQAIQAGGGILGIIGLIDGSAPFAGAFGGGVPPTIPGFMINLVDANPIRAGGASVRFDPANKLALVGSVVSTSSRGPMFDDSRIKPEIGAPGASVSAQSGTGTGMGAFGGTSGAAPMVTGSAALLKQLNPGASPHGLKQKLINAAEPNITAAAAPNSVIPSALAPVSRIGGGEVRVDKAASNLGGANPLDATSDWAGGISLGFVDVDKENVKISRDVSVTNNGWSTKTFTITPVMRFADDAANGAVTVSVPSSVTVTGKSFRNIKVTFTINGLKLRNNLMSAGAGSAQFNGGGDDPRPLTINEYDGYLLFNGAGEHFSIPWHVLPRKDANVSVSGTELKFDASGIGSKTLTNKGVGTAQIDGYSLLGISGKLPEGGRGEQSPTPDIRAFGVTTYAADGLCSSGALWAFAINTHERQTMPVNVDHQVWLDVNNDGNFDFVLLNADGSFSNVTDGRQFSWVVNLATGAASARFGAEHSTHTGNTVVYACLEQVGLTAASIGTQLVNVDLVAEDFYFGGPGDELSGMTIVPGGEQYVGFGPDIPGKTSATLTTLDFGQIPGTTQEQGLMIVTNGDRGSASRGGATKETEVLLFARPGGNVNTNYNQ